MADFQLTATAQGLDDTGGFYKVFYNAADSPEEAELLNTAPWLAFRSVYDVSEGPYGYFWLKEVGNGVTYVGESEFSEHLYYE